MGKASLLGQRRAEPIGLVAVHVPFDVADGGAVQQGVQLPGEVVPHLGAAEIQHQLVAAQAGVHAGAVTAQSG